MNTLRICKQCRSPLPADAPEGLCPQCLLKVGLGSETGGLPPTEAAPNKPNSEDPPRPAELAKHFPQFEILELLGQGGMGMVYKARQPKLDRVVALKILPPGDGRDPHFAERFNREAKALARLNHPNIVAIFDFGQAGPYYYFLMEFVDGLNLAEVERARRLTPAEALGIVPKICDALQYAHDEGVVHRDIKPGNILIDKKGRVKIADFGLAKLLGRETKDFTLTAAGMVMGTPRYMAPEQMERPTEVDHRADIYSLGVVFYEMLTGELPMGRFAPPSQKVQVDVRLDEVVLRSLERDVKRRYQHASEVKTGIETIASGQVPASEHDSTAKPTTVLGGLPALGFAFALMIFAFWLMYEFNSAWPLVVLFLPAYRFTTDKAMVTNWINLGLALGYLSLGCYGVWLTKSMWPLVGLLWVLFVWENPNAFRRKPTASHGQSVSAAAASPRDVLLRTLLWFILIFGEAMFLLPDAMISFTDPPTREIIVGAVKPWLVIHEYPAHHFHASPHFLTWSTFGGICALLAAAGLNAKRNRADKIVNGPVIVMGSLAVICMIGSLRIYFVLLHPKYKAAIASRAWPTTAKQFEQARSKQPTSYNSGAVTDFVRGPDGPQLSESKSKELGLTLLQAAEVNKIIQSYYPKFLSLERQHTKLTRDERGHVHLAISAFRDETVPLAERMNAEVRGVIGQDIVHPGPPGSGQLWFPHCGETTITTELWKIGDTYHFVEKHVDSSFPGGSSRSSSPVGEDWKQVFPEEYWIYWTEK